MILFEYQLRAVLGRLALTWPALAVVYLCFDLGDQGRRLAGAVGWGKVLWSSLLHLPLVSVQVLPAALLLGAVLSIARLRHAGELEAMALAGGAPILWLRPLLAAGLLATLAALVLGEALSPRCERRADELLGGERSSPLTGEGPPSGWLRQGRWFLKLTPLAGGRTGLLGIEHDGAYRVRRQLVGELDAAGKLEVRGSPAGDHAPPAGIALAELFASGAASLGELRARPETLGVAALHRRLRDLRASGRARPAEELLLQARFAFPSLNLIVALVAWTLTLGGRARALLRDLLEALLWLLSLFVVMALGWLLCRAGWLSPPVGAWLPLGVGMACSLLIAARRLRHRC